MLQLVYNSVPITLFSINFRTFQTFRDFGLKVRISNQPGVRRYWEFRQGRRYWEFRRADAIGNFEQQLLQPSALQLLQAPVPGQPMSRMTTSPQVGQW